MSANLPILWNDKKNSKELEAFLAQYGPEYCFSAEEINQLRDAVNEMGVIQQSTFMGTAEPGDTPTGTGNRYWTAVTPATYPNHGSKVVAANSFAIISVTAAGVWSVSQTEFNITGKLNVVDVVNDLISTDENKPGSANNDRLLNENIQEIKNTSFDIINPNLFDKNTVTNNTYIDGSGNVNSASGWWTSDFIPVLPVSSYISNHKFTFIEFYNSLQVRIHGIALGNQHAISTPVNTSFIRISDEEIPSPIASCKVELGTVSTAYSEYNVSLLPKYAVHGYSTNPKTLKEVEDEILNMPVYLNDDIVSYNTYFNNNTAFPSDHTGWLTNLDAVDFDGNVKEINIKVGAVGDYVFAVGSIDQWNKPIIEKEYSINIPSIVKYTALVDFPIKSGQHLFVKMSANILYFDGGDNPIYGNFLYSVTPSSALINLGTLGSYYGGIPFDFKVQNFESVFASKERLLSTETDIATLKNISTANILKVTSANTDKWQIVVSNTGVLSTVSLTVNKWLALGNSITRHPITSFWWGDWGMAATVREKDWVHRLNVKIKGTRTTTPIFSAQNIADWEINHGTYNLNLMDSYFAGDEDLVVIRLGENVGVFTNYETNFNDLIAYVKSKAPLARIVVTGNFWTNSTKEIAQKNASDANACIWVQLNQLDSATYKSTLDTSVYGDDLAWHLVSDGGATAAGVANHPGDVGMEAIADAIFSVI